MNVRHHWLAHFCFAALAWAAIAVGAHAADKVATDAQGAKAPDREKLVVHEWGTFTCLQDDDGRELAGINIDDEPLPKFVYNLHPFLSNGALLTNEFWQYRQKGAPRSHPLVTMRLETPVIYFYPPKDQIKPFMVNVDVRFRGGWVTEYYPQGKVDAPGLQQGDFDFSTLTPQTQGSISWSDLRVGTEADGPKTDSHVWLAPRKVDAVSVTTPKGESEQYLFYRGVANLKAPLRIMRGAKRDELKVYSNFENVLSGEKKLTIPRLWLADIRGEKTTYRAFSPMDVTGEPFAQITTLNGNLAGASQGLDGLKKEMHGALVEAGLFDKEATAMLSTWDHAYFQSHGLRLFFIVPREWTDHVLPLSLSQPAKVERVMIARLELVSEEQRKLLGELTKMAPSDGRWLRDLKDSPASEKFFAGRSDFGELGVKIPADFQTYINLGRFRNALVVAEERRQASTNLTKFINTYGLHPFRLPAKSNTGVAAQ